jgi:NRAMP (natural resistance-associated macrophage protein)-like metal ion transporter
MKTSNKTVKTVAKIEKDIIKSEKFAVNLTKSLLNYKRYNRFLRILGPGLVTGAADDDPSGVATYSQAGAIFGFGLLWAFPIKFPLLVAVQETCAKIGAVTGRGLAAIIKDHYSKKLLGFVVSLVVIANTINIGADIGAMAATAQLLVPFSYTALAIGFSVIIVLLQIFVKYRTYSRILKWLSIVLLAYPLTAIMVGVDWPAAIKASFAVDLHLSNAELYMLVAMLGTTISPYLFFWDTSETVEEEILHKRLAQNQQNLPKISKKFIRKIKIDNYAGMTIALVSAWFIVVACASALHANGITEINTAADAAKAFEPLLAGTGNAGLWSKILFSIGIIGIGLLAVPVLAGSSAYALSESLGWKEGLYRKYKKASGFYSVIAISTVIGLLINFLGIDPIKALIFSAVFNAVAAAPLLFILARIGSREDIMGNYKNSRLIASLVWLSFIVMSLSCIFLAISYL